LTKPKKDNDCCLTDEKITFHNRQLCTILIIGCGEKKGVPPANLIPEDKMISLLTDIRLLEGAYSLNYRQVDTSEYKIESYYQKIFKDYNVSKEQFKTSYSFYSTQENKMPAIENAVIERLSEIQAKQEAQK